MIKNNQKNEIWVHIKHPKLFPLAKQIKLKIIYFNNPQVILVTKVVIIDLLNSQKSSHDRERISIQKRIIKK